jgi:hypothetical protein
VTLASSYLRATARRTIVLCAGLSAAAVAFALFASAPSAPIVRLGSRLPAGSPRPLYEVLVTAAGERAWMGDAAAPGGISVAQYGIVRRLAGVAVAAPMTMIGYVPVKVTFPVAVPTAALTAPPTALTVTAMYRSRPHSGALSEQYPDGAYATAYPLLLDSADSSQAASDVAAPAAVVRVAACPRQKTRLRRPMVYVVVERPAPCWSATPVSRETPRSSVSVLLNWTFLLPLVAVDPAAEERLLDLDQAVIAGRYLPARTPAPAGPVPVIVASSVDDQDNAQLSVMTRPEDRALGSATVAAATAYSMLVDHVRAASLAVPVLWTPSGQSVAGGPLIAHHASAAGEGRASAGASIKAIGVFNPDLAVGSPAPSSPGRALRAAQQTAALAGYSGLATLVMPLQDIAAFTKAGAYAGADPSLPIGSIRVVVRGGAGDDALSFARVRAVAQEIVRATGLHVDVTVAGAARVAVGLDPGHLEMASLVLLPGLTFFVNGISATLHKRRRELQTLRALGWRRGQVIRELLLEFALVAAAGWMLALALAGAAGAVSPAGPMRWWPVLAAGAAVAVTLAAIWWPVRQALREPARRAPKRATAGLVVLALGCATLGQELATQLVFHGMIIGSLLGRPIVWQTDPADLAAAVTVLVVTTLAMADVHWLSIGKRAPDLRTLHAIGWPARRVVRLVVLDAVLVGALGGAAGCAVDLAGCLAVTGSIPASMVLVAASAAAAGVIISLVALGLAALARPRLRDPDGGRVREAGSSAAPVALPW